MKNIASTLSLLMFLLLASPFIQSEAQTSEIINNLSISAINKNWTFLIYMSGDNNLEPCVIEDINEMELGGGTNDDINIVVMVDRSDENYEVPDYPEDWSETRYYVIQPDSDIETINTPVNTSLGELNMGDPQNLRNFVTWGISAFPANRTALIFWDHGRGLDGTCWDDGDYDFLTIQEIQTALDGFHFDLIGFDACVMGQIEIVYELKDYCDVYLSSLYSEPGDGWPYNEIISQLIANPSMTVVELAQTICTEYVDSYMYHGLDVTMSAYNTSIIGSIVPEINSLSSELSAALPSNMAAIYDVLMTADSYMPNFVIEFYEFLTELQTQIGGSLGTAAYNVKTVLDNALIASESSLVSDPYGLWIFLPLLPYNYAFDFYTNPSNQIISFYNNLYYGLDFVDDTDWENFISDWRVELESYIASLNYPSPGVYTDYLSSYSYMFVQADLPANTPDHAYQAVLTMDYTVDLDMLVWNEESYLDLLSDVSVDCYYGSSGDTETALLPISVETTVFFFIYSYDGYGTFSLTISEIEYFDDIYEDNDNILDAAYLDVNNEYDLYLYDDDFFEIELIEGQFLDVYLAFDYNNFDLDFAIYDDTGSVLDHSEEYLSDEEISFFAPYTGSYYILVYLYSGDIGVAYSLTIEALEGPFITDFDSDPYYPDIGEEVTITCTVEGLNSIETVVLSYAIDGGPYTNVTMSLDSDGDYAATIPGTAENYVLIKIYAKDITGNWDITEEYTLYYYEPYTYSSTSPWYMFPTILVVIGFIYKRRLRLIKGVYLKNK